MATDKEQEERIKHLISLLPNLTNGQLRWLEAIIAQFSQPYTFERALHSDLINPCVLQDFGDSLRIHHCFSKESFAKDKFEYVFERVINLCGSIAKLAPRGNPGHDITIRGQRFSLKTQMEYLR